MMMAVSWVRCGRGVGLLDRTGLLLGRHKSCALDKVLGKVLGSLLGHITGEVEGRLLGIMLGLLLQTIEVCVLSKARGDADGCLLGLLLSPISLSSMWKLAIASLSMPILDLW